MIPLGPSFPGQTTSSGQHMLQPNRTPGSRNHQLILMEVTSRDRNYMNLVPSNPIRYNLSRPIKDVRSVELISGTIPAFPYNIVEGANKFLFEEGTKGYSITIPPGYYTASSLITQLNTQFSGGGLANTYTWSQHSTSGASVLTRTAGALDFSFLFFTGPPDDTLDRACGYFLEQNTPALQLGFDLADYESVSGVITSPFPMDLFTATNRLYLYINLNNSQDLGAIERSAGRRFPFAIIYMDQERNGYKFLNKETLTPASYSLPQPMSRLQTLDIEFRDEWFRIVNFNGKDFSLLLQFTVLE